MENRRQHYRHDFAPTRQFVVRLQTSEGAPVGQGELINLSIGGACVYAPALRKQAAEKWIVTLSLDATAAPLTIPVERVYARDDRACCGLRFLDAADLPEQEERDRILWKFLLAEQRRRRQILRGE
jgi:hypothetical protein